MKHEKIIKIALLVFPILVLVLCLVPDMVTYTYLGEGKETGFSMLQTLPDGVVASSAQLTFVLTIFTLIAGFVYRGNNSLAAIRLYMIFSATNGFFTAVPLATDGTLLPFPYAVFPILVCLGFALSLPVMFKEKRLYDARRY